MTLCASSPPLARLRFLGAVSTEELIGGVPEVPRVVSAIQCRHYGGDEVTRRATNTCLRFLGDEKIIVMENYRTLLEPWLSASGQTQGFMFFLRGEASGVGERGTGDIHPLGIIDLERDTGRGIRGKR